MSGKQPSLKPTQLRKQLLIAESEINRANLIEDGEIVISGVRGLTSKARSIRSLASMAGIVATGFFALRRNKAVSLATKHPWLRTAMNGAKTLLPLWLAFRRSRAENISSDPE